jgi:hypothetical protein
MIIINNPQAMMQWLKKPLCCPPKLPTKLHSHQIQSPNPNLDRITGRINSWTSKKLSFAGRLQLLSFVLFSLQVYWLSIFILPKKVLKDISQVFNRFLWNGRVEDNVKAKVAWKDVCFPKKEGGLGLKDLES